MFFINNTFYDNMGLSGGAIYVDTPDFKPKKAINYDPLSDRPYLVIAENDF